MGATISTTQFFLYGRKNFTKTGYERHIKQYTDPVQKEACIGRNKEGSDGVDLEGRVIMITGANSGIGKEMATYAAAKGSKVYMLCRSQARAEKAKEEIVAQTGSQDVHIVLADLAELDQVRKVVEEFQSKEDKLDCLVCNAGVLLNERRTSSADIEVTFASHFLGGSYLLTKLLIPTLKASGKDPRVIFVTSGGMYVTKFPDWDTAINTNEKEYNGQNSYAYAKRGQVLLAERWGKRIPEICFMTAHPGWSATNAVDEAFGDQKKLLEPLRSTWQGAEGITWLMGAPRSKLVSGAFYLDRKEQKKHFSGAFFSEGTYTKNTEQEVDTMMTKLNEMSGEADPTGEPQEGPH